MSLAEKRIQTALPECTYEDALYASSLYGMTMKSFAAAAIAEKTYSIIDAMKRRSEQGKRISLNSKEWDNFLNILENADQYDDIDKRVKEAEKANEAIRLIPVPEGEEL